MKISSAAHCPVLFAAMCLFLFLANILRADQLEMKNGDRYFGKVTSLNANSLILQSDVLGIVQLPRAKVATILIGTNLVSNVVPSASSNNVPAVAAAPAPTNAAPDSLRQLAAQTNLIQQVQSRFLADAGPEANAKFNELMTALSTGKINADDLRAEARKSLEQVRELKRGLSADETSSLDGYLSILEKFVNESPTNPPTAVAPKP
ncbi:MAG: hypothetical protein ABJC04_09250, partial [Verrucomicrobiota bacterium]